MKSSKFAFESVVDRVVWISYAIELVFNDFVKFVKFQGLLLFYYALGIVSDTLSLLNWRLSMLTVPFCLKLGEGVINYLSFVALVTFVLYAFKSSLTTEDYSLKKVSSS